MRTVHRCGWLLAAMTLWASAVRAGSSLDIASTNPLRGRRALTEKGCTTCHSIWGVGGKLGPDLAAPGTDPYFQQMASMFWNHTPRMVQILRQKGMEWPQLTEQEMADISGFIYYLRLLDRPGDAARGRVLYREKRCQACHALGGQGRQAELLSLDAFGQYVSPVPLTQAMWNAAEGMGRAQSSEGITLPRFEGREMADLQAYIRREAAPVASHITYVALPDLSRGAALFSSRGCSQCHSGAQHADGPDLSKQPLRKPISEICGILWNHSLAMQAKIAERGMKIPNLEGNDLVDLLAYIYFLHFSRDYGDAALGKAIFQSKGCTTCHGGGGSRHASAPDLAAGREKYTMLRLATSMWNHAPIMYETMESEVMKWIQLDPDDMQHLSMYLQSLGSKP